MSRLKIIKQTRLVGGELLNVDDHVEIDGFLADEMIRDGTAVADPILDEPAGPETTAVSETASSEPAKEPPRA